MTINDLKLFVAVYKSNSLLQAAAIHGTSEPNVSRCIRMLEKKYHTVLFERVGKRLEPTEVGKTFYTHAIQVLSSFEELDQHIRSWNSTGLIRVGGTMTLGSEFLPAVITRYKQIQPNLTICLSVKNAAKLCQELKENLLDFALIEGSVLDHDLYAEPIANDKLILLLPPGNPLLDKEQITLSDLSDQNFLMREAGSITRTYIDSLLLTRNVNVHIVMESVSTHAIINAVHEGLGMSILPEALAAFACRSGYVAARELPEECLERQNYLIYTKKKILTPVIKEFMDFCRKEITQNNCNG